MTRKPVLVATDLSGRDDRALDRALQLARQQGTRASVVHVLAAGHEPGEAMTAEVRQSLADPAADVDILLPSGSAPATIAATADQCGAGLIVVGVARMTELRDYILGTAVDYVVRHARVPTLVVKRRPHKPYAKILIATDFSDGSRAALLAAAAQFPDARLDLINAYHVPFEGRIKSADVHDLAKSESERMMEEFLQHESIPQQLRSRVVVHIRKGQVEEAVRLAFGELETDLFAIGAHGASGFVHATIGSRAAALLRWAPMDTLVVRAP